MIHTVKTHIIIYKHMQPIQASKAVNIVYKSIKAYKHTETHGKRKKDRAKKDRKFQKLKPRYQFLLYYKRTKKQ